MHKNNELNCHFASRYDIVKCICCKVCNKRKLSELNIVHIFKADYFEAHKKVEQRNHSRYQ